MGKLPLLRFCHMNSGHNAKFHSNVNVCMCDCMFMYDCTVCMCIVHDFECIVLVYGI